MQILPVLDLDQLRKGNIFSVKLSLACATCNLDDRMIMRKERELESANLINPFSH